MAVAALVGVGGWDVLQVYTGLGLGERSGPPMAIVAHRGDLDRWPENTLEAITAAAQLGVDGIEFDAAVSADGTWWVLHDASLDRTTDATGPLSRTGDAEIARARIDGGIGFDAERHRDLGVPRLADVLEAIEDFPGTVFVDVQHSPAGDVTDVARLLDGRQSAILCRNLEDARAVRTMDPTIRTFLRPEDGPADGTVDGWLMEAFFEADAGALQSATLPVVTFVDQWRAGQDESGLIRRAWAVGVEAFLTKAPRAALAAREELSGGG